MDVEKRIAASVLQALGRRPVKNSPDFDPPVSTWAPLPVASRPFDLKSKNAEEGAEQAASEDTIQVTVKPLKGSGSTASGPVQLRVGRLDTIDALKRLVEAATGVPVAAQRLVVGGRGLVDGKTLLDFDVADGATVSLLRKPGGAAAPAPAATAAASAGGSRAVPPAPATVPAPVASPSPITAAALDPTFWKDLRGLVAARVRDRADQNTVVSRLGEAYVGLLKDASAADKATVRRHFAPLQ
ncbi:hypothetical protein HK405_001223 [Cladochytrium tenue]|nr:hypothetical protein HK405_001223 [Cladochytrium tenue]